MPGRDQTGPHGTGPDGRGLGPCRDEVETSRFFGRFSRWGRRGGRGRAGFGGRGGRFLGTADNRDLEAEENYLKQRLAAIQEKLKK